MKKNKINIVIAGPSYIIYEGLCSLLRRQSELQLNILKAEGLSDIARMQPRINIDMVLLDTVLIQNQTKYFESIKKELPDTQWTGIIYSFLDPQMIRLFDAVININETPLQITEAIKKLHASPVQTEKDSQTGILSERETEVLKLLVTGNSNREIADKLFISTHTVITHRKNISQKTGIKSVSGLTIYAVVNNIIGLDNLSS